VHEVAVATPRHPAEVPEERRKKQDEPGAPAHVSEDAVAECKSEVLEVRRRDHLDFDTPRADGLDRVGDEPACRIVGVARIRRRQDEDLHARRRANTTGSASASATNP